MSCLVWCPFQEALPVLLGLPFEGPRGGRLPTALLLLPELPWEALHAQQPALTLLPRAALGSFLPTYQSQPASGCSQRHPPPPPPTLRVPSTPVASPALAGLEEQVLQVHGWISAPCAALPPAAATARQASSPAMTPSCYPVWVQLNQRLSGAQALICCC